MNPYKRDDLEVKFAGLTTKNLGFITVAVGVLGLVVLSVSLVIMKKK